MTERTDPVRQVLLAAAERAEQQSSIGKAIAAGWSALHADTTETMARCFAAWATAEDFGSHPSGLGTVLRRQYKTPGEVGGSLRQAAGLVSGGLLTA